jgi:hypothetical protein
VSRLRRFAELNESRPVIVRPVSRPDRGSLRIAPAEIRSYSGPIRLIAHTVVENEHCNTRLRDD